MKPLRVAAVPYLNALPLYVGLPKLIPETQIISLTPAEVSQALKNNKVDLGIIPVFSLLNSGMNHILALPDLGICSQGEVLSVYLGAKKSFNEIKDIYLDPESKTSAALTRILSPICLSQKISFLSTLPGYEKEIQNKRAGLIIGDRALLHREAFPYRLDLGKLWLEYTNLPFVFALWAMRREIASERVVKALKISAQLGVQKIEAIAKDWAKKHQVSQIIPERYLKEHIYYQLGPKEHEGLKRFIHLAIALDMIHPQREINYYDTSAHYRSGISRQIPIGA